MCVIMCSDDAKPSREWMEAGHQKNPWGAGVAWIEKDRKNNKWVRWVKGITDVNDVIKLVEKLTPPLVVHFRIPTEGLNDISLTHPFPVSETADLSFEGKTKGQVLFHNGGWGNWRQFSLETAMKTGRKLPTEGMLSDSRMMAWNADYYGPGFLYLINEKVILMGPDGIQSFGPVNNGAWEYDSSTKIWTSNNLWRQYLPKKHSTSYAGPVASGDSGGDRPMAGFRPHRELGTGSEGMAGGRTHPQQMEGRQTLIRPRPEQVREVVGKDGKAAVRYSLVHDPDFIKEVNKLGDYEQTFDWRQTRRSMQIRAEGLVN